MSPELKKDEQTVTPEGAPVKAGIEGVRMRRLITHEDERGEICEIFHFDWGVSDKPLVYVYQTVVRPGKVKGWIVHRNQDDRIFASLGVMQWALYDDRSDSPTYKRLQVFSVGERSRTLFVIPRGVFHAVKNIGRTDAYFVNMPTAPYKHTDPDKYRLPLENDMIPFSFEETGGW
ncbi:MAG TPA: hypothetical protein VM099_02475 [Gemmatimonadaceae bacterium]|nr:hypothetical protein [Gemmatimonadaceae bacterium]